MLPNSVASKNRLFLERDSKHRRITANFGATFRNSKWADYSIKNTDKEDRGNKLTVIKAFLISILLLLTTILMYSYSSDIWIYSCLTSWLSNHHDFTSYLNSYWRQVLPLIWHYTLKAVWEELFRYYTGEVAYLTLFSLKSTQACLLNVVYKPEPSTLLSTDLINLFNTPNSSNNFSNKLVNPWLASYDVVSKTIDTPRPTINHFTSLTLTPTLSDEVFINKFCSAQPFSTSGISSNLPSWSLTGAAQNSRGSGLFYTASLNYQSLNNLTNYPELLFSTRNVMDQNTTAKMLRWSYRYSILHRKTLMNSHKLTSTKKLIASGFFDKKSSKYNLWFSDNFHRIKESKNVKRILNSQWHLLYQANLGTQPQSHILGTENLRSTQATFKLLSHYESSFHFFVKRAYQFLNLGVTNSTSSLTLNSNDLQSSDVDVSAHNLLLLVANSLTKSLKLTNGLLSPYSTQEDITGTALDFSKNWMTKDVVNITSEYDFLMSANLETMINLTQSLSSNSNSVNFYGSVGYKGDSTLDYDSFDDRIILNINFKSTSKFNHVSKLYSSDRQLIQDLDYIALLLK